MPRGDRTGPLGEGPMTGRGLGYGGGYNTPGYTKGPGRGLGLGFGFGRGRGFFGRALGLGLGRGYFGQREEIAPPENVKSSDSLERIKADVQALQNGISALLGRLNKLASSEEKTDTKEND